MFPSILTDLFNRIGVDVSFGGYGLKQEQVEDFCELVYNSFQLDLKGHPKPVSKKDLVEIMEKCM
ncbi:MAG: hypothetical protein HPY71_09420 [Firmicutes bacterium]|nr:hypothetical protein [Bacillota bacterium]